MHPILRQVHNLPPQAQQQVINLVMTLLKQQRTHQSSQYLRQNWAGALRHERTTHTSLSLQQETVDDWASRVAD